VPPVLSVAHAPLGRPAPAYNATRAAPHDRRQQYRPHSINQDACPQATSATAQPRAAPSTPQRCGSLPPHPPHPGDQGIQQVTQRPTSVAWHPTRHSKYETSRVRWCSLVLESASAPRACADRIQSRDRLFYETFTSDAQPSIGPPRPASPSPRSATCAGRALRSRSDISLAHVERSPSRAPRCRAQRPCACDRVSPREPHAHPLTDPDSRPCEKHRFD